MTKCGQNAVFEPKLHFNVAGRSFCRSERLIGAMLNISENLSSKSQRSRSPYDQIWAKLQFRIHNCIQMYLVATFIKGKD